MQVNSWITQLERIPTNFHDSLALILTTGSEIVVQQLVRLDADFLILRGRMAGTQDTGRVVILPYSQLSAVAVTRPVTEGELSALLGEGGTKFAANLVVAPEPEETVKGAEADANTPTRAAMPSKSMLLAKLRARLAENPTK